MEQNETGRKIKVSSKETKGPIDKVNYWENKIKKVGAASVLGKFHPDWFAHGVNLKKVVSLEDEPGFKQTGNINSTPKDQIEAYLNSVSTGEVFQYGQSLTGERKISEETDQLVLMSPVQTPEEKYNVKMLDGRFTTNWRAVSWGAYVKEHKQVPFRTPTNPMSLTIFLPDKEALSFFKDIEKTPDLPEKIFHRLYPKIPYKILGKKRLFAKSLSEEEAEMPYARSVQQGGKFFDLKVI